MAEQFTIKIEGLEELQRNFRNAGVNYRGMFSQAMQKATQRIQNVARNTITANGTTFQGNLVKSVTEREANHQRGVVAVGEKYGAVVEFGRTPGKKMPPVQPIERWASRKLGVAGIGFIVARKIAKEGTKAQPYMEPTFRSEAEFVLRQFSEAARQLVVAMAK